MNLEPLILEDLLNGNVGTILRTAGEFGLKYDTKGAISDDFAVSISDFPRFTGLSIRSDDFYNLAGIIDGCKTGGKNSLEINGQVATRGDA